MFSESDIFKPQILAVEKDFLVVYKPPCLHSAPLVNSPGETILHWCSALFPEVADVPGRKAGEGGLLHRLDYETQGLMLLTRNRQGMESLLRQQAEGKILKEYNALTAKSDKKLPGFPVMCGKYNFGSYCGDETMQRSQNCCTDSPIRIQSAFRAYGPGRKAVRPVSIDINDNKGEPYTTEILDCSSVSETGLFSFRLRIWKGFRHQIRAHLAWLGFPILNDSLYGGKSYDTGLLALRAYSISFNDPTSNEERSYSIPQLLPAFFRISAAR